MKNIAIKTAYDGTCFCGWQVQPDGRSVSAEIIGAIKSVTGETVKLYGSGRTDAGVHAYAQVANFFTETNIPPRRLIGAINAYLPKQIVVTDAWEADIDFNARFSAKGKIYEYLIQNAEIPSPFLTDRVCILNIIWISKKCGKRQNCWKASTTSKRLWPVVAL